ncbi:MAG TPA: VOC family protein [Longimicrobium sp.]|nr:VOC family protein [Longimicrobium sp.]
MQPITQGSHHVTMVAADARRTLAFYRDVLGLGMVKQTVDYDDPGAYHLYFGEAQGRPGTLLTFFEWPHAPRGRPGIGGVHHTALGVETDEALLKWKRRLADHGVHTSGPYDRGYFTSLYFRDPDGQIMEIATAGPGYAIDEPMEALGRALLLPPERIVRGHRDEAAIAALTWPEPVPLITPDMALHGIHHVSGITDDLTRSGEFYEQALGLRMVKKTTNRDDANMLHYFWAAYDGNSIAPHSSWTLFGFQPDWNRARGGIGQTHHVAFRARDEEEQRAWREHLLSLDVQVSQVMDRTYFKSLYFSAPDGQLVEIATDGPGFAVDEDASELGSSLQLPAWLEPRRREIGAGLAPLA